MKRRVKLLLMAFFAGLPIVILVQGPNKLFTMLKANTGDAGAQYSLASIYYADKNLPQAIKWYKKAALQPNSDAQYNLGVIYQSGEGIQKDEKAAIHWYEKAAKEGHVLAQYNLGLMHAKGQSVPQSFSLAFSWFEQAAIHGLVEAQYTVGEMYEFGDGVAINLVEAYKWFAIAHAPDRVAALETKMTPEQIDEANRLIDAWKLVADKKTVH